MTKQALDREASAHPRAAAFSLEDGLTLADALRQTEKALREAEIDTPRLDAQVLLAHVLDVDRTALLSRLTAPLPAGARGAFENLVERRLRYEPIAYLIYHKEFYGLDFYVDRRVLIPRPETELLVDRAVEISKFEFRNSQLTIADVGTGSGCIAVALAVRLPDARIYATEVSAAAMEVAQLNIERHGVRNRVYLVQSDLLGDLASDMRFHIIAANLPYVSEPEVPELPPAVLDYEPVEWALAAGPDGLDPIRRLLDQAPARLHRDGVVLLEIGWQHGPAAEKLARQRFPKADIRIWPDLAGRDRAIEIQAREEQ